MDAINKGGWQPNATSTTSILLPALISSHLQWTNETELRATSVRMQDSVLYPTSLASEQCASGSTQREAWHKAPFLPGLVGGYHLYRLEGQKTEVGQDKRGLGLGKRARGALLARSLRFSSASAPLTNAQTQCFPLLH